MNVCPIYGLVTSILCLQPLKSVAWRGFLASARLSGPRTHFSSLGLRSYFCKLSFQK